MGFFFGRKGYARVTLTFTAIACSIAAGVAVAQSPKLRPHDDVVGADLPYPPPQRPSPGDIAHVPTGLAMSFDRMMDVVAAARLVCVGETHDNVHAHEAELRIIRDLARRFPGRIAIGMEMFRAPQQSTLDRWTRGELTELEFLKAVDWQRTWGLDFGYYRAILEFARDQHIDVVALNPSEMLQTQVEEHGVGGLPPDLAAELPELGTPDPWERTVMKAVYAGHVHSGAEFDAFFRVQRLWEESMAQHVVEYLKSPRGQGKAMITLTGGGHVEYGFGLPKNVLRRMPLPYVIIEPREIETPPAKQMMNVKVPAIPLLPADFVWWVAYEDLSAQTVHLGVRMDDKAAYPLVVGKVEKGSPAEAAGVRPGDEITSFASHLVASLTELVYWTGMLHKGDSTTLTLRRAGATLDLRVMF